MTEEPDAGKLHVRVCGGGAQQWAFLLREAKNVKTHYKEVDSRSTPLRFLCTATENAIKELIALSKVPRMLDGLDAKEIAEYQYGAVFVAWQAYAVGTVSDINEINESIGKRKESKIDLYRRKYIEGNEPTQVEFINALANYFKHHEEWASWPDNHTTRTLKHFGVNESTEFPLSYGVELLVGEKTELRRVCEILENWRFGLVTDLREKKDYGGQILTRYI